MPSRTRMRLAVWLAKDWTEEHCCVTSRARENAAERREVSIHSRVCRSMATLVTSAMTQPTIRKPTVATETIGQIDRRRSGWRRMVVKTCEGNSCTGPACAEGGSAGACTVTESYAQPELAAGGQGGGRRACRLSSVTSVVGCRRAPATPAVRQAVAGNWRMWGLSQVDGKRLTAQPSSSMRFTATDHHACAAGDWLQRARPDGGCASTWVVAGMPAPWRTCAGPAQAQHCTREGILTSRGG